MKELKPAPALSEADAKTLERIDDLRTAYKSLREKRAKYKGHRDVVNIVAPTYFAQVCNTIGLTENDLRVLLIAGLDQALENLDRQILDTIKAIESKITV